MHNEENNEVLQTDNEHLLPILRGIVARAVYDIEKVQLAKDKETRDELTAKWSHIFGTRDNVVAMAVKLVNLLSKITIMEKKLMNQQSKTEKKIKVLSEEDIEIIKEYQRKISDDESADYNSGKEWEEKCELEL